LEDVPISGNRAWGFMAMVQLAEVHVRIRSNFKAVTGTRRMSRRGEE